MFAASNIGVYHNCIGFYLVVKDMYGVIGWDACDFSQVEMLEYCFVVVDSGYCHPSRLGVGLDIY